LAIDPPAEPLLQIVRPLSSSTRRVKYHEVLGKPMADDDLKSELEQLRAENVRHLSLSFQAASAMAQR
jgi:hypothetical protein